MLKEGVEAEWEVRVGVEKMGKAGPWMAMHVNFKESQLSSQGTVGLLEDFTSTETQSDS